MSLNLRKLAATALVSAITLAATAVLGEVMLRIKNSDQRNYMIEMWRYSNELKRVAEDPALGHVHVPGAKARLQGVDFVINDLGMRGPPVGEKAADETRILMLGSSITLGWGVPEEETMRARVAAALPSWTVLNGGIGNYNTARSVRQFETAWRRSSKPDMVVLQYFLRDAEYIPPSEDNALMRHSQLAVTLWYIAARFFQGRSDVSGLEDHYHRAYQPDSRGYREMVAALDRLNAMAQEDGFRVVLAMIPDIHQLQNYPFTFVHRRMRDLAVARGWDFVDFMDVLGTYQGPELWAIPGDPHPNAVAHGMMGTLLAKRLSGDSR
ncbi:MAG: SGNH/GDSL hydrolase family protein [Magnetospirillum sp.]|nr:SGNH/GDSL hydrolase family protein [Magnetospirillum sp.]